MRRSADGSISIQRTNSLETKTMDEFHANYELSQRARSILFNVSFQIYDLGGKLVESSFPIFSRPFNRSNDVLILSLDFSTISFLSFFIALLPPFLFRVSKLNCELEAGRSAVIYPCVGQFRLSDHAINRNIRGCAYCILIYTQM